MVIETRPGNWFDAMRCHALGRGYRVLRLNQRERATLRRASAILADARQHMTPDSELDYEFARAEHAVGELAEFDGFDLAHDAQLT